MKRFLRDKFFNRSSQPTIESPSDTIDRLPDLTDPDPIIKDIYEADDEQTALALAQQIPDIDAARRMYAYVDIHKNFSDAMDPASVEELKEVIVHDIMEFCGERLPDEVAEQIGVPEELVETTPRTGVVDFVDVQAVTAVWDEVQQDELMANTIAALIEQFREADEGNQKDADLFAKAFERSLRNGKKISDNRFMLLNEMQAMGKRLDTDAHDKEVLEEAARRDRARIEARMAKSVLTS